MKWLTKNRKWFFISVFRLYVYIIKLNHQTDRTRYTSSACSAWSSSRGFDSFPGECRRLLVQGFIALARSLSSGSSVRDQHSTFREVSYKQHK